MWEEVTGNQPVEGNTKQRALSHPPPHQNKKRGRVGRRVGRIHAMKIRVEIHKKENRTGCRYEQWRIRVYVDMGTFTEIGTRKM